MQGKVKHKNGIQYDVASHHVTAILCTSGLKGVHMSYTKIGIS